MRPCSHDEAAEVLGAWVFGACDAREARRITAHVEECYRCRTEADRLRSTVDWIGAAYPVAPPEAARSRVLAAASGVRAPGRATDGRLLDAYAGQVGELAALLGRLDPAQWESPVPHHGTVAGLVTHLAGNDRTVLEALGPRPPDAVGWREQSELLLRRVGAADPTTLERTVELAGSGGVRRPVRDALVQRTFETWTHADDVRRALRLPARPASAADVRMILDFGLRLLPTALTALGRAHPGRAVRLVLTGSGGGDWDVPLGSEPARTRVATVLADAVDFCRLMAGRRPVDELRRTVTGDGAAVADFLYVASQLGCD